MTLLSFFSPLSPSKKSADTSHNPNDKTVHSMLDVFVHIERKVTPSSIEAVRSGKRRPKNPTANTKRAKQTTPSATQSMLTLEHTDMEMR